MVRRHYPVLAQISLSYSEPKGRFPRVTHPCATHPEGFVRLACVRHAASVRSEPGSNSQVCETNQSSTGKTPPSQLARVSRSRYLLSNVMDTNEHASSHITCGGDKDVAIGLKISGYCDLEARRPGAVAHMSLHQKPTMSKSRRDSNSGQRLVPRFTPGEPAVRLSWRPIVAGGGSRQRRVGGAHLCGVRDSGKRFLHFCFKKVPTY